MEVTQGKLIIGMDLDVDNEDLRYDIMIYNSIFGGSANSKLFQNVREKQAWPIQQVQVIIDLKIIYLLIVELK